MNENVDIFVFADREFEKCPDNPCYKLVSAEPIQNTHGLENVVIDHNKWRLKDLEHAYSEGARIDYIRQNYKLKDYVGTAHYRRYFGFYNNIPNINDIFKDYDAILPSFNINNLSLFTQYSSVHNENDVFECIDIIRDRFPEYFNTAIKSFGEDLLYPCNIFIVKKETFLRWCDFVFGVLDELNTRRGYKSDSDVAKWVLGHKSDYGVDSPTDVWYQSRIHAFLMERLSTIFFRKEAENPLILKMALTEGYYRDNFTSNYILI